MTRSSVYGIALAVFVAGTYSRNQVHSSPLIGAVIMMEAFSFRRLLSPRFPMPAQTAITVSHGSRTGRRRPRMRMLYECRRYLLT